MVEIIFMTGTFPEELKMIAMIVTIGTLYACNLGQKGERFVQKFWAYDMRTISDISSIFFPIEKNCKHMNHVLDLRLQPYI